MNDFQFRARLESTLATDAINSAQCDRLKVGGARAERCATAWAFDFHGHQEFLASGQPPFCAALFTSILGTVEFAHRIGQPLARCDTPAHSLIRIWLY